MSLPPACTTIGGGRGGYITLLYCLLVFFRWAVMTSVADDTEGGIKSKVPIVTFQQEGVPRSDTLLRYLGDLNDMTQMTVCFRVKVYQARNVVPFMSYATTDNENEFYVAVDLRAGHWRLANNGHPQEGLLPKEMTTTSPTITGGGTLILGQEQDALNGGFDKFQSLRGSLMDVRMYDELLATTFLVSYSLCEPTNTTAPPTLTFSNIHQDFEASNVVIEETNLGIACPNDLGFEIIFPELRSFLECESLCHRSGGYLMDPKSSKENIQLFNKTVAYSTSYLHNGNATKRGFWLGVRGNMSTQTWMYSSLNITYHNFEDASGLPIIPTATCVLFQSYIFSVTGNFGEWLSKNCDFKARPVCQFDRVVTLRIRGLCKRSKFDRRYLLIEDGRFPKYVGEMFSEIVRPRASVSDTNSSSGYGDWMIIRRDIPSIRATLLMETERQYPVGLNTWQVEDDECGTRSLQLIMTSCKEHQFSCTNGQCINVGHRCNMEVDCTDSSDEAHCTFMEPPENYESSKPPARQHHHTPISIGLHVNILTITELDISEFKFVCEIELTLEWYDSRLEYHHLNYEEHLNVLEDISDVWTPSLEYLGHGGTSSEVRERKVTFRIRRLSQPLPNNDEQLREGEVFPGLDNLLVLKKKLTVTTLCLYKLEAFPFDTQTCTMGLVLSHFTNQYVALVPEDGGVTITGERRMLQYVLVSESMMRQDKNNYSGQSVELIFKNLSTFYVFSTYLPTLVIVIIGYVVFFFPINNFNERIMVGLTGLLVEATFFSQVSASIPGTAYLKLVDIWFVFCIISLFLVVVSVAVIQWLQDRDAAVVVRVGRVVSLPTPSKRHLSAHGVNRAARVIFPLLAGTFLSVYVTLATGSYFNHR